TLPTLTFSFILFFLMILLPPRSTLFPYTTLFRSRLFKNSRWRALRCPIHSFTHSLIYSLSFLPHQMPHIILQFQHESFPIMVCRSEEHTSELQSRENLVCRLLLEKKKKNKIKSRH